MNGREPTQMVGLQLRFQERLRAQIEAAAAENGNSLNGEIVARIIRSFDRDELDEIKRRLTALEKAERMPAVEPLAVPARHAFDMIGIGITKGYELINNGDLEVVKVGKATRITIASIKAFIERNTAGTQ